MEDKELAKILLSRVVNENLATYRELFAETSTQETNDIYWKDALVFFEKLAPQDRDVFFNILKQVSIDTVSNIAGIIDGSIEAGVEGSLHLTSENGTKLGVSLQDYFLEAVEKESN